MDVGAVVKAVSLDLNDQERGYEYAHWPYDMLLLYLHEALVNLSAPFKKYFISQKVVRVEPGDGWQKACDCESILSVPGESTEDGQQIIRRLRRYDDAASEKFMWSSNAPHCSGGKAYQMSGYVVNSADDSLFRVIPPVPRDEVKPHYVLAECFSVPSLEATETVPDSLVPLVKQWMLMRAYAVDSENNPVVVQLSETHRQTYFRMLEIQLTAMREITADDRVRAVQSASAQ